ncbi:MAG: redoxin domain-containing protein [Bacteroidia bacterium]|nr:redoxin domain-containing protein [Bacteroidia bacterium]MDW8158921.1 redoxin domain-containing protein [Bacteroidia bacterium]
MVKSYAGIITAPKIPNDVVWLNTQQSIDIHELKGKTIILAFWNWECIEGYAAFIALAKLQKEFPNTLVIHVHSPHFEAHKDLSFIQEHIVRYEISEPVIVDNKFHLCQAYGIQGWPSVAIIDPLGKIAGTFWGEDMYENLKPVLAGLSYEFSLFGIINFKPLSFSTILLSRDKERLSFPTKIIFAPERNSFFISDTSNHRIIECSREGKVLQVIGNGKKGNKDGTFEEATFFAPQGLAWDSARNMLYVADTLNHLIRKVDFSTGNVSTIAGSLYHRYIPIKKGKANEMALHTPLDIFLQGDNLYIAMGGLHQIWVLNLNSNDMYLHCGSGFQQLIDGHSLKAALALPNSIFIYNNILFFTEGENSSLRYLENDQVKTFIGKGLFEYGDREGPVETAALQYPQALAIHENKVFIADSYNHKIKVLDLEQRIVYTLVGTGKKGNKNASGLTSEIAAPAGLVYCDNALYFTDTHNSCVKRYDFTQDRVDTFLE